MIAYLDPQPLWQDISVKTAQIMMKAATPVTITFDYLGKTYIVNIPTGWTTDMGSVPELVRNIVPNTGAVDMAYILHDAIYGTGWTDFCPDGSGFSRKDADTILYLKLKERGLSTVKSAIVYDAVRLFGGGSHWRHAI